MKTLKIITLAILALCAVSISTKAQKIKSQDENIIVHRSGKLYKNWERITESNVNRHLGDMELNNRFIKANKCYRVGKGLLIGGGVSIGTGLALFGASVVDVVSHSAEIATGNVGATVGLYRSYIMYISGITIASAGAVMSVAGWTCYGVGVSKLKKVRDTYNERVNKDKYAYLSFDFKGNGVGLSLHF